jgi:hypothetical protein
LGNRIRDLVIVIAIIAGAAYLRQKPLDAPDTTPAVTPAPAATAVWLSRHGAPLRTSLKPGTTRKFDGKGPLVVVLTAVQCGDCITRIPRDNEIYAMAKKANIPYYNVLVYVADDAAGAKFVKDHQPAGDDILNDPGGSVFVGQYLGSDNNCQMVIGRKGEFLYRGPENKEAMQKAIASL